MAICTLAQVKASARIDGSEFDTEIIDLIPSVQSMIEHECGVASGTFDTAPDAGANRAAVALCVALLDNPTIAGEFATANAQSTILKSALLDKARSWL
jgi:hypothetical protein